MSRVPRSPVDPDSPNSIAQQQRDVIETIDNRIEFGEPLDPRDPTSVILAGNMAAGEPHNGTRSNILGSWVELEVSTLDFPYDCVHNLYQEQPDGYPSEPVAGEPNCRWFVVGWQHDGTTRTLYEDLRVSPTSARLAPGQFGPDYEQLIDDGAGSIGVFCDQFDDARDEMISFAAQIPHNYKQGTAIEVHVHWVPMAGGNNEQVSWAMEYSWCNRGDVFQTTPAIIAGDTHTPADAPLVTLKHYVTELGDITLTGDTSPGEVSSMINCRLWRDTANAHGTDDLTGDAGFLEVDFHYEVDGPGSDEEDDKTSDVELEWSGTVSALYNTADTGDITANSMPLRFYASPFLDVSQGHELKVTLFFIKATR